MKADTSQNTTRIDALETRVNTVASDTTQNTALISDLTVQIEALEAG